MEKITKEQIAKFHVLLSQLKLMEYKVDFVYEFSNGRATSTKDLTKAEGTSLIRHLATLDPCDRMRRKVFAMAYKAGFIWGDTWEDKKMNAIKLNAFLNEKGTVRKDLGKMSKEELIKTVNQFEQISKHTRESTANKEAAQSVGDLLAELNMPTQSKGRTKRR